MGNSISKRLERYASEIDRIANATKARANLTGAVFNEFMMAEQVVMRSLELSQSTFYVEKAAVLAWLNDAPDLNAEHAHSGIELLSRSRADLLIWGRDRLTNMVDTIIAGGDMRSPEEISFEICGLSTQIHPGKIRHKHVPVSVHDIDRLTQALIDIDPLANMLLRLRKTKIDKSHALSAILLHSCWLTGMRPVEMFGSALLIIRDGDVAMAPDALDSAIPDITDRDYSGIGGLHAVGAAIAQLRVKLDGNVVLAIRNAKTQNANPDTVQDYRLQSLAGIDDYRLGVLWLSTQLRRLVVTPREVESLRDLVSRHARTLSKQLMPNRPPVTLYTMRHDFADRAKRRYTRPEVAALMGHTGKNSGSHYGTKGSRRSSAVRLGKPSADGWMPQPDAEQAQRLFSNWTPSFAGPEASFAIETFEPLIAIAVPVTTPETSEAVTPDNAPAPASSADDSTLPQPSF